MTPPTVEPPSLGEVVRLLDQMTRRIDELIRSLNTTYVRQDVYAADGRATEKTTAGLREDLDAIVSQQLANRRLAVSGLILPVLVAVIVAVLVAALVPA